MYKKWTIALRKNENTTEVWSTLKRIDKSKGLKIIRKGNLWLGTPDNDVGFQPSFDLLVVILQEAEP